MSFLQSSSPARIVNVSSIAHSFVTSGLSFEIRDEEKYGDILFPALKGYDASKLGMVLHAKELAKRFSGL